MEDSDVQTQLDSRRSEKPISARTGKGTEEFMQGPQSAPCTEFCTPRRWTGRAGAGGTRTANKKKAERRLMEGLATLLRSIKEGDNNQDDDSDEDNDREMDSNSELDSEDEHRDMGAAGDEGESKLFQSLSRIVNRYRQGKVQNLLSELQELLTAGEQPDRKRSCRDVAAKGITPETADESDEAAADETAAQQQHQTAAHPQRKGVEKETPQQSKMARQRDHGLQGPDGIAGGRSRPHRQSCSANSRGGQERQGACRPAHDH